MSVRWLVRAVFAIFYRVDRVGEPPREGPVLLLPNHPNALLDPAVVRTTDGREVRFLARSTLLQGAFRPLLRAAKALVDRRSLLPGRGDQFTRNVRANRIQA